MAVIATIIVINISTFMPKENFFSKYVLLIFNPHFGQFSALSLISFEHSGQFIKAI